MIFTHRDFQVILLVPHAPCAGRHFVEDTTKVLQLADPEFCKVGRGRAATGAAGVAALLLLASPHQGGQTKP